MKVSKLGEFGLIDLLAKIVSSSPGQQSASHPPIIGIGDDTAAWQGDTSIQLATVDTLVQDVHFSLDTATWKEIGWKSLAINLSDIAAMGGAPQYALVSLALPEVTEVEDVVALYDGLLEMANYSGTVIAGGNISGSPAISITITVLGKSQDSKLLRRSTARPGDAIAVTGHAGSAAAGLEMLKKQLKFAPEVTRYLREAFLHPVPRLDEGQVLVKQGVTTAIDTSDGLLADLGHICKVSQVSARVEIDRLPVHPAVSDNFGERVRELALAGGEDYELLFTAGAEVVEGVRAEITCPVTIIGEITAGKPGEVNVIDAEGNPVKIDATGWKHF